jgi:hypothetical protein
VAAVAEILEEETLAVAAVAEALESFLDKPCLDQQQV